MTNLPKEKINMAKSKRKQVEKQVLQISKGLDEVTTEMLDTEELIQLINNLKSKIQAKK